MPSWDLSFSTNWLHLGDLEVSLAVECHYFMKAWTHLCVGITNFTVGQIITNKNLSEKCTSLGLTQYINRNNSNKGTAPKTQSATIEAILGGVYLDSARDIGRVKQVMEALKLSVQDSVDWVERSIIHFEYNKCAGSLEQHSWDSLKDSKIVLDNNTTCSDHEAAHNSPVRSLAIAQWSR